MYGEREDAKGLGLNEMLEDMKRNTQETYKLILPGLTLLCVLAYEKV